MEIEGLAPSALLAEAEISPEDRAKRPFYVYDKESKDIFGKIMKVLAHQTTIGIAVVFDAQSMAAGLKNVTYFVVAAESPPVTYVFSCVQAIAVGDLFLNFRRIFQNPKVMKVVHAIDPVVAYLYQRQYIEVQNVVDLQVANRVLRKIKTEESLNATLEELVRLYIDRNFKDPLPVTDCNTGGDDREFSSPRLAEQAAMQGAYLLDLYRCMQQVVIEPVVDRLGLQIRNGIKQKLKAVSATKNAMEERSSAKKVSHNTVHPGAERSRKD